MGAGIDSALRFGIKDTLAEMSFEDFGKLLAAFSKGVGIDELVKKLPNYSSQEILDIFDNFNEYTDEEAQNVINFSISNAECAVDHYDDNSPITLASGGRLSASAIGLYPQYVKQVLVSNEMAQLPEVRLCLLKAAQMNVPIEIHPDSFFADKVNNSRFQTVMDKRYMPLEKDKPHIMVYDSVNRSNLGAIIRSGVAFGFTNFALVATNYSMFHPKVIRVSRCLIYSVNCMQYATMDDYLADYPDRALYPFALDSSITIDEAVAAGIPQNSTVIFGNETKGLPKEISSLGKAVRIPIRTSVDSLNVASAATIGLYVFAKALNI